jgi:hypothetical protein
LSDGGAPNGSRTAADSLNGEASFLDHLGCTAGREQAHILLDQALGKVEQASLVVDRQDGDLLVRLGGHCRVCLSLLLRVGRRGTFAGKRQWKRYQSLLS